jgi:hypothetical protein
MKKHAFIPQASILIGIRVSSRGSFGVENDV